MVENGRKWVAAVIWQEMDFRVLYAVVIEVTRKTMIKMAENGRKWQAMAENGRKLISAVIWQEMDFRVLYAIPLLLVVLCGPFIVHSDFSVSPSFTFLSFFYLLLIVIQLFATESLLQTRIQYKYNYCLDAHSLNEQSMLMTFRFFCSSLRHRTIDERTLQTALRTHSTSNSHRECFRNARSEEPSNYTKCDFLPHYSAFFHFATAGFAFHDVFTTFVGYIKNFAMKKLLKRIFCLSALSLPQNSADH